MKDTYMEDEEEVDDLTMYKIHNQVHHEPLRADKPFVSFVLFAWDNDLKHIMVYDKLKDYVDSPGNL